MRHFNHCFSVFAHLSAWVLGGVLALQPTDAFGTDIPVESEADYQIMLDAIRATEYTRQNYLEDQPNPRAVAGIAGLWAYAEANPLATPEQFAAFVNAYDGALASAVPGDDRLARTGSLLSGLIATRIDSAGLLAGTDTRVARRAIELLGVDLPGLDGYQESRVRMARYDLASVQAWINRTETADALTCLLAGVNPSGERVEGLATAAADYLDSLGLAPMLGAKDPEQQAVNAGLEGLPSYEEFLQIRDTEGAHLDVENEVFMRIDEVQLDSMITLQQIGVAEVEPNLGLNSLELFVAANDPEHPDHEAALAQLQARRDAVIEGIRDTSDDRAAIFARTLILQQSNYPDVDAVATVARSFAGLQMQANNGLVIAQHSVGIAGSLVGLGASYATGNVMGGVQATISLVGSVIGLADALGADGPSGEEQIYDEMVELRQQVENMRVQMHARFDIIDAKLDTIFETMISGFGALGEQIGDLQEDVDDIAANLAEARTTLDRIEAALFGFAEDALLLPLSLQTDLVLDYRNDSGVELFYQNENPNFVDSASFFYTYATTTSKSSVFAGPTTQQLTLENAESTLSAQPIARTLNDLRRIPSGLSTTDGSPVTGPITSARVGAPAPWSQAAAAYVQLAQENPWYFAFMLRSQITERGGNAEVDDIIADGQRIVTLADATRDRADLFNGILQRAIDRMPVIQNRLHQIVDIGLQNEGFMQDSVRIDPWGPLGQTASPLVDSPSELLGPGGGWTFFAQNWPHRGYEITVSDNRLDDSASVSRAELAERNALAWWLDRPSNLERVNAWYDQSGSIVEDDEFDLRISKSYQNTIYQCGRTIRFIAEIQSPFDGQWGPPPQEFEIVSGGGYSSLLWEAWHSGGFRDALQHGDLTGATYEAGEVQLQEQFGGPFPQTFNAEARLRVLSDTSSYIDQHGDDYFAYQTQYLTEKYKAVRDEVRSVLASELASSGSVLTAEGEVLDNTNALLDAYLTLGMADAMTQSELLRSATQGVPSAEGLGFRYADIAAVLLKAAASDEGELGGAPGVDLPGLEAHMTERILALSTEIDQVLGTDAPSFPYVEFVLAELNDLRENAFRLAIDDTYLAVGAISVDGAAGLMANDVGQAGRINNQELAVDQEFFSLPEHIAPSNGTVTVSEDGSFSYSPDPGFTGTDSFTYRLIARVDDSPNPIGDPNVRSEPATVVIHVGEGSCPADVSGDGVINLADLNLVLANFGQMTPDGDTNGDGQVDLADLNTVLAAFGTNCP